jgi:hypothetical protein
MIKQIVKSTMNIKFLSRNDFISYNKYEKLIQDADNYIDEITNKK